ncbi:MAG: hypothetical protein ACI4B3_04175 [Prevotella sp.]
MTITTDMPVTKAGSWALAYEEQMDAEVLEVVEGSLENLAILGEQFFYDQKRNLPAFISEEG